MHIIEQRAMRSYQTRPLTRTDEFDTNPLDHLAEILPDIVYIYDLVEQRTIYINPAVTSILGYTMHEIHTLNVPLLHALLHPDDLPQMNAHMTRLMQRGTETFLTCECRVRHADGGWRTLAVSECVLHRTAHEQPIQVFGIVQDITGCRTTEQALRQALERKDTCLREMHHRIKNNLQFLSSLFSLHADLLTDSADRAVFQEAQDRIQAIALAHDMLLPDDEQTVVNLGDYLQQLFAPLSVPLRRGVTLTLRIADAGVAVPMPHAIACGMIANELVANALKHAFLHGQSGTIAITLEADPTGAVILRVSDDGIGLPAHVDVQRSTRRGFMLVKAFTQQVQGSLRVERTPGTRITLTFPAP